MTKTTDHDYDQRESLSSQPPASTGELAHPKEDTEAFLAARDSEDRALLEEIETDLGVLEAKRERLYAMRARLQRSLGIESYPHPAVLRPPPLAPVRNVQAVKPEDAPGSVTKRIARDGESLTGRYLTALSLLKRATNAALAESLGIPQQRAASIANALKRAGKIKKHGRGKQITWTVV